MLEDENKNNPYFLIYGEEESDGEENNSFHETKECIFEYLIDQDDKIKIFGNRFVKNNKDNCYIIHNEKKYELTPEFNVKETKLFSNTLEIKLKINNPLTNISYMFNNCKNLKSLKKISYFNEFHFTNLSHLFSGCYLLQKLPDEISLWNTEKVISMEALFYDCSNLHLLPKNIAEWNTENVLSMKDLFNGCSTLELLPDISKWNTKNVISMNGMFGYCSLLKKLPDITEWNTNKLEDIGKMFEGCSLLESLPDISKWNTNKITNIEYFFSDCSSLKSIPDLSKWNTENFINIEGVFNGCKSLENVEYISNWNTKNVRNMNFFFQNCDNLKKLGEISKWDVNNVERMSGLFCGCKSLEFLPDISKWKSNNNLKDIIGLFYKCSSLKNLPDISEWKLNNIESLEVLFYGCSSLTSLPDISKWNTSNVYCMNGLFYGCTALEVLPDISKWNTNNLTNIGDIFNGCSSLLTLPDISKWNTENINIMNNVFYNCLSLNSLPDISEWNTRKVEDMSNFFYGCSALKSLPDISKWITNNVILMNGLFYNCSSLKYLPDISEWNTEKVEDMNVMFYNCLNLLTLPDISKWNVKNVKTMNNMFSTCYSLKTISDLSKWEINNVISMNSMFYRCCSLEKLPDISKWFGKNIDMTYIFYGCTPSLFIDDIYKWNDSNIDIMVKDSKNENIIFNYELLENYIDLSKKKEKYNKYYNNKEYAICRKCNVMPLIKFNSFNTLNISCKCFKIDNVPVQFFINNYIINIEEERRTKEIVLSSFFCKIHTKKFKYYCLNCKKDFCKECLKMTSEHTSHQMFYFAAFLHTIKMKTETIKEKFYKIKNIDFEKIQDFERIISIFCNNYEKYNNYNLIKSIENIYTFFFSHKKEIKSKAELIKEKNLDLVNTINFYYQNFDELTILCKKNLINLEILILKGNCITDISPLIHATFKNLKYLNLGYNEIGDDNIQYFQKMDFKYLSELNLCSNHLTDFEFFKTIINFPKLKVLLMGKNIFKNNINQYINDTNNDFKLYQLEEIGLSNGVLSDNNIKILSIFKFHKLKNIYLNINNLSSLEFMQTFNCADLETIWLSDNNIKEFMPLTKYRNLKKIDINTNNINNINCLEEFISNFQQLEVINMKYNNIDLNEIKNIKIINNIRKVGKIKLNI